MLPRWLRLIFPFLMFFEAGEGGGGGGAGGAPAAVADPPVSPPADDLAKQVAYLQSEIKKAAAERDRANTTLRQTNEVLADFQRKDQERLDAAKKAEQDAEGKKLEDERKYTEALALKDKKYADELAQRDNQMVAIQGSYARNELEAAVARVPGVVVSAAPEIAHLLAHQIGTEIRDGRVIAFVKGLDGRPRMQVEDPTKPFTVSELAAEFVNARPHFRTSPTPAGSGAGAGAGEGAAGGKRDFERALIDIPYREEWKKADPDGWKRLHDAYLLKLAKQPVPRR